MEWLRRLAPPTPALVVSTRVGPILALAAARSDSAGDRSTAHDRVAAVHTSAVNVGIGGAFVTIARASVGGLPAGIGVDDAFAPRTWGVSPGAAVSVAGSIVRLGDLSIDLHAARPWSPHLAPRPIPADLAERAAVLRSAVEPRGAGRAPLCAADRRRLTGPAIPLALVDDLVAARIRAFGTATRRGDTAAIRAAGRALVGLGVGLTPSGDDVLVGYSAGRVAIGGQMGTGLPTGRATDLAADWSAWADGRTTDVAVAFHRAAAEGDFSERLHIVLAAILEGPIAAIPAAAERATAWGATSGRDTLIGVLVALEAAAGQREAARPADPARPVAGAA